MKHTKIVATISDWMSDPDYIKALHDNGLNVVRMNTAHIDRAGATKIMNNVRSVSDKIALLLDTKGPEVRTTKVDSDLEVTFGDKVKVTGDLSQTNCLHVNYPGFVNDIQVGTKLLIDDGEIELEVKSKDDVFLHTEVTNNGIIQRHAEACRLSGTGHRSAPGPPAAHPCRQPVARLHGAQYLYRNHRHSPDAQRQT